MSTLAIDINDAGITVVDDSRPGVEAAPASPGFALLDEDRWLTGVEAARRYRLKPKWTHTRFWMELDTSSLRRPFPRRVSRADLAHAHLEAIWTETRDGVDDVILSMPGWYTGEQLGLVFGIAQSLEMNVSGMVDSALSASALSVAGETLIAIDIHLHRASAARIVRGRDLRRERIEVDDGVGEIPLMHEWAKLIARRFVLHTRFDPLHLAETEQNLYRRLPRLLDQVHRNGSAKLVMEAAGKEYSVELSRDELIQCAAGQYDKIAALARSLSRPDEPVTLLLPQRLAGFPGLEALLTENPAVEVSVLPPAAASTGALMKKELIRSGGGDEELTFVTRLSLLPPKPPPPVLDVVQPPSSTDSIPTHVLHEGIAHPIPPEPFWLGRSIPEENPGINFPRADVEVSRSHCSIYRSGDRVIVEDHSSSGSFLNDRKVESKAELRAGDRLRLGPSDIEVQLITVRPTDASS
jgi:hypothetical protein